MHELIEVDVIDRDIQRSLRRINELEQLDVTRLIRQSLPAMNPPESWQELSIANKLVDSASGRNRETNGLQINIAKNFAPAVKSEDGLVGWMDA